MGHVRRGIAAMRTVASAALLSAGRVDDQHTLQQREGVTVLVSPEPRQAQQPCGLIDRFELNGDMSRTDFTHDYTPHGTSPRSLTQSGTKADCRESREVRRPQSREAVAAGRQAFLIPVPFLCRVGTVRLMPGNTAAHANA